MKKISLTLIICLIPLSLFTSCTSKKDRLTADTLTITIDPSTAQTKKSGETLALKAICRNPKSDDVNISPSWSVENNLGSFNPSSGKSTTFTAGTSTGTGKIYATYGSVRGEVGITINTTGGGGSLTDLNLYHDAGIPPISKLYIWCSYGEWGIGTDTPTFNGSYTGDPSTPEGTKCFETASDKGNTYAGWGVFYVGMISLSDYSGGHLVFWLKSDTALTLGMEGPKGTKIEKTISSTGGIWQLQTIPISDFSGVDLSQMFGVFILTVPIANHTFYVDDVKWTVD